MATPNVSVLSALAIANGVRHAWLFEQVCNIVLTGKHANAGTKDASVVSTAASFVAGSATAPWWLEQIGNKVLTYPFTRSDKEVLNWPTS